MHGMRMIDTIPDGYDSSNGSEVFGIIPYANMTICGHEDRLSNIPDCTYNSHDLRKFIYCLPTNQLLKIGYHMPSRNEKSSG
jgi:hypothetical protein